jgi:hypothetical protein
MELGTPNLETTHPASGHVEEVSSQRTSAPAPHTLDSILAPTRHYAQMTQALPALATPLYSVKLLSLPRNAWNFSQVTDFDYTFERLIFELCKVCKTKHLRKQKGPKAADLVHTHYPWAHSAQAAALLPSTGSHPCSPTRQVDLAASSKQPQEAGLCIHM